MGGFSFAFSEPRTSLFYFRLPVQTNNLLIPCEMPFPHGVRTLGGY
jgi:hypothetical protein